ncbi:hypothetical protein [Lactiplantibacillus mudanjiangensis]
MKSSFMLQAHKYCYVNVSRPITPLVFWNNHRYTAITTTKGA